MVARTEIEWMLLLLRLSVDATERVVQEVKVFLEGMWYVVCGILGTEYVRVGTPGIFFFQFH